jgi:holo-[acyl-carrier protein] synthase
MVGLNPDSIGIGIDIERISRFQKPVDEKDEKFLNRIFTRAELDYCLAHARPYSHLAARYAGKEAVVKALTQVKVKGVYYSDIEIFTVDDGAPQVNITRAGYSNISIKLSLSHSDENAIAFALVIKA